MIKRLLTSAALMLLTSDSLASGFYVGAGVGPDTGYFEVTSHIVRIYNGITELNVKDDQQNGGVGAFGDLFVGYGLHLTELGLNSTQLNLNSFYLGGEFDANLSSLEHRDSNDEFVHQTLSTTTYRMRYGYGISIIPGYSYSDATLFYARLGYANSNFKIHTSDVSLVSINRNLSGLRWGFGLQQCLCNRFAARLEYDNITYKSTSTTTITGVNKKTKFTPYINQFQFALVYEVM